MKPELFTALVAAGGAIATILNVWVTLKLRIEVKDMRQEVLDRVDTKLLEYKRSDVCEVEMKALTLSCGR